MGLHSLAPAAQLRRELSKMAHVQFGNYRQDS